MKKVALILLTTIAFWGIAQLTYQRFTFTSYLGDIMMKEEVFWKTRKSFEANVDSPLIPIQIPGPLDTWAGGEPKEISMQAPYSQSSEMTIEFLDSHESSPTQLEFLIDGKVIDSYTVKAGVGKGHTQWRINGKRSSIKLKLPVNLLRDGGAVVTMRSIGGSWSAIDKVTIKPTSQAWVILLTVLSAFILILWNIIYITKARLWKQAAINLALTVYSIVITLVVVEFAMRALFPQREFVPRLRIVYQADDEIGFILKPNVVTELGFNTNSYGMRDYDHYTQKKPTETYRILAVGDSQTFSVTSMENSYPKFMERMLAINKMNVEVMNAGVAGYGPDEEYFHLNKYGLAFEPDLVTLGIFVGNDITDSLYHPVNTALDGDLVSIHKAQSMSAEEISKEKKKLVFLNQFHLYRFLNSRNYGSILNALERNSKEARKRMNEISGACIHHVGGDLHKSPEGHNKSWRSAYNKTVGWLKKFNHLAQEKGFDLVVVLIPTAIQMNNPEARELQSKLTGNFVWDEPQKSLTAELTKSGIAVYNALETMKNEGMDKVLYYCGDTHLNELGNQILASGINKWIIKKKIIPAWVKTDMGQGVIK